jgi:hypothetical protein
MGTKYDDRAGAYSMSVSGKVGRPCGLGLIQFGRSVFGELDLNSGVYKKVHYKGGIRIHRYKHYIPKSTLTPALVAGRNKFKNGMLAWKDLTSEQKAFYNNLTYPKGMHGVNRFMRAYMRDEV